jgi:tetratricopeptide (TPR) repeat protein
MRNCNGERSGGRRARWGASHAALAAILLLPTWLASWQDRAPEAPSNLPFTLNGPEATTTAELDAFGLVMEATSPSSIIAQAEAFVHQFPDSQLRSFTQLRELQAEIDVNSYEGTLAVGHDLLHRSPRNLEALILMAGVLPNFSAYFSEARKADAVKEAREDIQAANELLQTFHPMEGFSPGDFLKYKRKLRLSLKEAAAFADLAASNNARAIQEYQEVLAENPTPTPIIYFRLGVAYYRAGQTENARKQLERARQADTGLVRKRAAELLDQIADKPGGLQTPAEGVKQ